MEICIDFDGTCVTHEFPNIGKEIGAERVLKRLVDNGHRIILFTMRSDIDNPKSLYYNIYPVGGQYLTDAVNWFKDKSIPLYGVNANPKQSGWTHSPKAYGQLYIDDASIGCPLLFDEKLSKRPFVDWNIVEKILEEMNLFKTNQ